MEYAIEVENLTKTYGELNAVDNISFKVNTGEVFAFLGPNGAGKTTTVEIIETIRKPTSGHIKVLGFDFKEKNKEIKERIGVLPQEFTSFQRLTVRETLLYFSQLYKKRKDIDSIIDLFNLKDKENAQYHTLSGGLKQRVGVAMALVNDPDIVFLDEPTTGLDPRARRDVWKAIAGLKQEGKTVFLTTHYMEEAEYLADHIAIIHKGKIVGEGTVDWLIDNYGEQSILLIKGCKTKDTIEVLQNNGYQNIQAVNGDVEIKISKKDAVIDILFHLREKNIYYREVDIKHSDLEDVFLNLTGEKLQEVMT
ncbi:MAG: ABC transporter ATP-binding protein [Candidatus Thermoplasmatota archaeon]|nr:ABC transporter ATP-binding protein [Candidatus Thermoplasmatota archaeon]